MINKFIIFNNDFKVIKKICNNLFCNYSNIKLSGIASTEKELSYLLKKTHFNVIIVPYEYYTDKSIANLVDQVEYKIFLCNNTSPFKNSKYNLYIPIDIKEENIAKSMNSFICNSNKRLIQKKVNSLLEILKFDFKLTGTKYLLESIVYSYLNKDNYLFENLEKQVFPYVSKQFSVTPANVKWSIIRSINNMNIRLNKSDLKKTHKDFPDKLTCKLLITEIVNHI